MTMNREGCEAYQERDGSHYCGRCGFRWGLNDPNPPGCLSDFAIANTNLREDSLTPIRLRRAGVTVSQTEQDEINRRGMAKLREALDK